MQNKMVILFYRMPIRFNWFQFYLLSASSMEETWAAPLWKIGIRISCKSHAIDTMLLIVIIWIWFGWMYLSSICWYFIRLFLANVYNQQWPFNDVRFNDWKSQHFSMLSLASLLTRPLPLCAHKSNIVRTKYSLHICRANLEALLAKLCACGSKSSAKNTQKKRWQFFCEKRYSRISTCHRTMAQQP